MKFNAAGLLCVCLLLGTANAGVYMESVQRDTATGKITGGQTMYMQNGIARFESGKSGNTTIFKDDAMYQLDNAKKTYRVMDKAALAAMSVKMSEGMARMKERMDAMPPEQRAKMEQMLQKLGAQGDTGAGPKTAIDASDTGKSESSEGRSCRLWNISRGGVLKDQLCVVPRASLPGSDEVMLFMKNMSHFFDQLKGPMSNMGNGIMQQEMAVMTKIDGFPIISRHFSGTALSGSETIVKAWQKMAIPSSQFEVPADYRKVDFIKPGKGAAE
jgi:hypothetical protein